MRTVNPSHVEVFGRNVDAMTEIMVNKATFGKQGADKRELYNIVYPLCFDYLKWEFDSEELEGKPKPLE